jgi:hypothetical protein
VLVSWILLERGSRVGGGAGSRDIYAMATKSLFSEADTKYLRHVIARTCDDVLRLCIVLNKDVDHSQIVHKTRT